MDSDSKERFVWVVDYGDSEYLGIDSVWDTEEAAKQRAAAITKGNIGASVTGYRLNTPDDGA